MKISLLPNFTRVVSCVVAIMIALSSLLFMAVDAQCSTSAFKDNKKKNEARLPKSVEEGLDYLFSTVAAKDGGFDAAKIMDVIRYVDETPATDKIIALPKRDSASGAAMRFVVDADMKRVLEYTYNPAIPNYAIYPSVIRVSGWHPGCQFITENVQPWKYLDDCDTPRVWRGREFEVNTPDSFGGAYYRYDLDRLLVLMKYEGRDVFLTVSKQMDKSSVGMKGLVVDDDQWNYFYSGIPGLTSGVMGWMDTFMYDSMSVNLYIQDKDNPGRTVSYLFKWLRAGWAGINVVRPKHIFEGSQRFARAFSDLMESKTLPAPEVLAEKVKEINSLSDQEVDLYLSEYSKQVEIFASKHPVLSDEFPEVYENGKYTSGFTREERIGILVKEYVKQAMGKRCYIYEKVVENK
ncbi:hypothetical protein [Maridesulfovibrio hydrothermalis]|uniref:Uncharacterized protein n=1 Tax=Maridesulfovibrio hydrothermalis AM13 = DSM 14728 TaxID=1121451 RepID=L0R7V4_9BACT|nr:hypothetical protein [Maridesulfovibrio hydrothermalis]CCO22818.1 conserved exported protein of unknown function [Maridesulfovibrio hydrothermalis AM13 = DSM 14728]